MRLGVQAVKMMHSMMSCMGPEQLAAMSKASGHELSPEQACASIWLVCGLVSSVPQGQRTTDWELVHHRLFAGSLHTEPECLHATGGIDGEQDAEHDRATGPAAAQGGFMAAASGGPCTKGQGRSTGE